MTIITGPVNEHRLLWGCLWWPAQRQVQLGTVANTTECSFYTNTCHKSTTVKPLSRQYSLLTQMHSPFCRSNNYFFFKLFLIKFWVSGSNSSQLSLWFSRWTCAYYFNSPFQRSGRGVVAPRPYLIRRPAEPLLHEVKNAPIIYGHTFYLTWCAIHCIAHSTIWDWFCAIAADFSNMYTDFFRSV